VGCLIFVLALIGPRVALFFVWVATDVVTRAYDGFLLPFVGFLFLPWTTLVYALAYDGNGLNAIGWFFVILAFIADISSYGMSGRRAQKERQVRAA
jgi:hypothetical protein